MPLPQNGVISYNDLRTELGVSSSIAADDIMTRGLHGSNTSTALSLSTFYLATDGSGKKNPWLANVRSRIVISAGTGVPSVSSFILGVAVLRANNAQTIGATAAGTITANNLYSILAQVGAGPSGSGTASSPTVLDASPGVLMNFNNSTRTGVTPSARYLSTAWAITNSGTGGVEDITSADASEFLRVDGSATQPAYTTSNGKSAQIQTRMIIEFNQYYYGTRSDTDYCGAGWLRY